MKSCIKSCIQCIRPKKRQSEYKIVERELLLADWPPVGQVTYAPTVCADVDPTSIMLGNIQVDSSNHR